MSIKTHPSRQAVDLGALSLRAKIDYVTIHTKGKVKLPSLTGKAVWPRRFNGLRLTVHDASKTDIETLIDVFGYAYISELEIAIDFRPRKAVCGSECESLLQGVMVGLFARGLEPSAGMDMSKGFRAFYRRLENGYIVRPFNLGLPRSTDQQLHGGRHDAVQVKSYWKRRDHGVDLSPTKQVARVEVRMGSAALAGHDLNTLNDISGFKFRKKLMPYFTHVSGTRRTVRGAQNSSNEMLKMLVAKQHAIDKEHFAFSGVGPFVPGGERTSTNIRLMRDIPVNHRLGQALTRLEQRFCKDKFVRPVIQRSLETQHRGGFRTVLVSQL